MKGLCSLFSYTFPQSISSFVENTSLKLWTIICLPTSAVHIFSEIWSHSGPPEGEGLLPSIVINLSLSHIWGIHRSTQSLVTNTWALWFVWSQNCGRNRRIGWLKRNRFLKWNTVEFNIISLKCCFRVEEERMSKEESKSGWHNKSKTEILDINLSVQSRAVPKWPANTFDWKYKNMCNDHCLYKSHVRSKERALMQETVQSLITCNFHLLLLHV